MANGSDKQDWIHNQLKTSEPTYDGNYHPEHYQGCGVSIAVIVIIAGVLEMAGGGVGINNRAGDDSVWYIFWS